MSNSNRAAPGRDHIGAKFGRRPASSTMKCWRSSNLVVAGGRGWRTTEDHEGTFRKLEVVCILMWVMVTQVGT